MKVSFPYMGSVVVYKKFLELLGHDVVVPPRPSKKTIDLGVKHSPEFACFPFKCIMGSYIEVCDMGVDTIITSGGHGPCRAGFYGEVHKRILKNLGYDVEVMIFDSIARGVKKSISQAKIVKGKKSWLEVFRSAKFTYDLMHELDKFDKEVSKIRPYEVIPGSVNKVWNMISNKFDKACTYKDLKRAIDISNQAIKSIKLHNVDKKERIRIGLIGEIYVVMESSINMEIEKLLNELGCETEKSHYISDWVTHNMIPNFIKKSHEEEILKKGEQYMEIRIGGHAKQTVGHIVDFKEKGFDGIIHLMPFACLPELVSQSIIPKISKEQNIPVLTLSIDEQTGRANNKTRIEAFVDLIKNKKRNKLYESA